MYFSSGRSPQLTSLQKVVQFITELLLSPAYRILPIILLSVLNKHVDEINGHYLCGFWRNSSTVEQAFIEYLSKNAGRQCSSLSVIYRIQECYSSVMWEIL